MHNLNERIVKIKLLHFSLQLSLQYDILHILSTKKLHILFKIKKKLAVRYYSSEQIIYHSVTACRRLSQDKISLPIKEMSLSREYFCESNYDPMCCHWNRFTGDLILTVHSLDRAFQITCRTIIEAASAVSAHRQTRSTSVDYNVPMWRERELIHVQSSFLLFWACGHCYRICQECYCRICHQPNDL